MQSKVINAMGAYGRKAKLADYVNGRDFKLVDGPYFSIRDEDRLRKDGYTEIRFYANPMNCAWDDREFDVQL